MNFDRQKKNLSNVCNFNIIEKKKRISYLSISIIYIIFKENRFNPHFTIETCKSSAKTVNCYSQSSLKVIELWYEKETEVSREV